MTTPFGALVESPLHLHELGPEVPPPPASAVQPVDPATEHVDALIVQVALSFPPLTVPLQVSPSGPVYANESPVTVPEKEAAPPPQLNAVAQPDWVIVHVKEPQLPDRSQVPAMLLHEPPLPPELLPEEGTGLVGDTGPLVEPPELEPLPLPSQHPVAL